MIKVVEDKKSIDLYSELLSKGFSNETISKYGLNFMDLTIENNEYPAVAKAGTLPDGWEYIVAIGGEEEYPYEEIFDLHVIFFNTNDDDYIEYERKKTAVPFSMLSDAMSVYDSISKKKSLSLALRHLRTYGYTELT